MKNKQTETWNSDFGNDYTDRNIYNTRDLDIEYFKVFESSRSTMNFKFLKELELNNKNILEVGCNVGNQLAALKNQGMKYLYGIELQSEVCELARLYNRGSNIIQANAEDIPFKDNYFEMVFTSGVLIHISPENINKILDEIYRCSNKYIWGFEYFAEEYTNVEYRGQKDILWKTNFAKLYLDRFSNLELIKEERFTRIGTNNIDSMFLLQKR